MVLDTNDRGQLERSIDIQIKGIPLLISSFRDQDVKKFFQYKDENDVYGCNKSLAANQMLIPPMIKPIAPTAIAKIKNFFWFIMIQLLFFHISDDLHDIS